MCRGYELPKQRALISVRYMSPRHKIRPIPQHTTLTLQSFSSLYNLAASQEVTPEVSYLRFESIRSFFFLILLLTVLDGRASRWPGLLGRLAPLLTEPT